MNKSIPHPQVRSLFWSITAALFLVSLVTGSMMGYRAGSENGAKDIVQEMHRLDLLSHVSPKTVTDLLDYHSQTGKSLAQILQEPVWCTRLGLTGEKFRATWYMSNPYDLLPTDLQQAIRQQAVPFQSRTHVNEWCRVKRAPAEWRSALVQALIETTPLNLWRAGRGERPYVKNGEFIEPIVIDRGNGRFEVRDGHIATDPNVIPTNTTVILLVTINGEERILKVKAADTGCGIIGKHVDLPIRLSAEGRKLPYTLFPSEVSNATVKILMPIQVVASPGQKV